MFSYSDMQLVRELAILLVFCLFIAVAVVTGWWQSRRKAQQRTSVQQERLHSLYIPSH